MRVCDQVTVLDYGEIIARATRPRCRPTGPCRWPTWGEEPAQPPPRRRPRPPPAASRPAHRRPTRRRPSHQLPCDVRAGYGRIEVVHGVSLAVAAGAVSPSSVPTAPASPPCSRWSAGGWPPPPARCCPGGSAAEASRGATAGPAAGCAPSPKGAPCSPTSRWPRTCSCTPTGAGSRPRSRRGATRGSPVWAGGGANWPGAVGGEQQMLALARALFTAPAPAARRDLHGPGPAGGGRAVRPRRPARGREHITVVVVEQFAPTALAWPPRRRSWSTAASSATALPTRWATTCSAYMGEAG